jgi:glycerol uptake facilitator-like aquaporin
VRVLAAELIGTFALVFAGAGAIMVDDKTHQLGHVGVAIAFAFALTRHFSWTRLLGYWAARWEIAPTSARRFPAARRRRPSSGKPC